MIPDAKLSYIPSMLDVPVSSTTLSGLISSSKWVSMKSFLGLLLRGFACHVQTPTSLILGCPDERYNKSLFSNILGNSSTKRAGFHLPSSKSATRLRKGRPVFMSNSAETKHSDVISSVSLYILSPKFLRIFYRRFICASSHFSALDSFN